jgi:TonB family protein
MYRSRFEPDATFNFEIPWDRNVFIGFATSVIAAFLFIIIMPYIQIEEPEERNIRIKSVPLVLLNFGDGDGTGMSKGNLQTEGQSRKGDTPPTELHDAAAPQVTKQTKDVADIEVEDAGKFKPVDVVSADVTNKGEKGGDGKDDFGVPDGASNGTGLGSRGFGKGKGSGFGDIEWGGGGNRVVLQKHLPKFPDGVRTSATIKIRFTVLPDGTVGKIIPLQKADPRLERAAMDALRKWRFNALNDDREMVGTIPLSFVLR